MINQFQGDIFLSLNHYHLVLKQAVSTTKTGLSDMALQLISTVITFATIKLGFNTCELVRVEVSTVN
jgi:hypothetical protein